MNTSNSIIANQVFIGCPHEIIKRKYEQSVDKLIKQFPLSFILVGRNDDQDAEDLLELIKEKLMSSSYAIFDATGGNANVSLEYGLAEANEIKRALYLSVHGSSRRSKKETYIIADLAGKKRNHYSQVKGLVGLLVKFAKEHNYTKRFEKFLRGYARLLSKGDKRRVRYLALKIIHALDNKNSIRREDVVQDLRADQASYKENEIQKLISAMHSDGLIRSGQGSWATLTIQ